MIDLATSRHTRHSDASRLAQLPAALAIALIAATLCSLAGCTTNDEVATGSASSGPITALNIDANSIGYSQTWIGVAPTVGGITLISQIGDEIAVVDSQSTVSALSGSTGGFRWSGAALNASTRVKDVRRIGDTVYIGDDGEAVALKAETGELIDRQHFQRVLATRSAVVGNLIVFGSGSGELYAHDAGVGLNAWMYQLGAPISVDPVTVLGRRVGVINRVGKMFIIDAASGSAVGTYQAAAGSSVNPVAGDGKVFFASDDQSLYAINAADPVSLAWRVRTEMPLNRQPMYGQGKLILVVPGSGLTALSGDTGKPLWTVPAIDADPVAMSNNRILVRTGEQLISLEAATGQEIARITIKGLQQVLMQSNNQVILGLRDGRIIKLSPR